MIALQMNTLPTLAARTARVVLAALLGFGLLATPARAQGSLVLEEIVFGLTRTVGLVAAGDGSDRLFVVEQGGQILILEDGALRSEPFLDLSASISCCGEQGLLGLAFHPQYEDNGFFFVNYTNPGGDSVVARFAVSAADANLAARESETEILTFEQPFSNHNGGHLAFGPDGYLYISSGDGGSGGDPQNNAQDLESLLGKILRLDIDGLPVAIPPDNPFVGAANSRPEIWAYGLRNPWRFSFDRETGDLFIGDVGQSAREEIDFQSADSAGGENYGWRIMEGSECFQSSSGCGDDSLVAPILEYGRDLGCSVTGGFRYRGRRAPALEGVYVFGDFCSGTIWGATEAANGAWSFRPLVETDLAIASFGEDESGELYVVHLRGSIHRLVSTAFFRDGFEGGDLSNWKKRGRPRLVSPGLDGSGFAAGFEAGSRRTRLRTKAPDRETAFSLEFSIDPGALEQLELEETIALLGDAAGVHLELRLKRRGKRFRVTLYALEDAGLRRVARRRIPARKPTRLGVSWQSASAPGAADGVARLFENGRARGSRENLRTGGRVVDFFDAGFPFGAASGSGELVLDEFVLAR